MILKAACLSLVVTVLALVSLIVAEDDKVCFDYGRLKDKAIALVQGYCFGCGFRGCSC